jgi:hypothetical protein
MGNQIDGEGIADAKSAGNVAFVETVECSMEGPTYQPSKPCVAMLRRLSGVTWMTARVPGGRQHFG